MEIIHQGPVPPYRQIAARLRERIDAGEFVPERDPLPSRRTIAQDAGVALTTVDRALAVLEDEGLIFSAPTRGWYVKRQE